MGLAFANDIAGGITLVRPALRSPNYVAGVSGWSIDASGSAEFNNVTVRGVVDVVGSNGSEVKISAVGAQATIALNPGIGGVSAGRLYVDPTTSATGTVFLEASGTAPVPFLQLDDTLGISLFTPPSLPISIGSNGSLALSAVTTVDLVGTGVTINTVDQGLGLRDWVDSTGSTAAIGAETVAMTSNAIDWTSGRCYKVTWSARLTASAAQSTVVRIRTGTTTAGALLGSWQQTVVAGGLTNNREHTTYIKRTGATTNTAICLTYAASAGTITGTGAADTIRYFKIEDIGTASQYPNAVAI